MTSNSYAFEPVPAISDLAAKINEDLVRTHGPLLQGQVLSNALGYRSTAALRRAELRKTVPVPTFLIAKRKGRFALALDVAGWVALQRFAAEAGSPGRIT